MAKNSAPAKTKIPEELTNAKIKNSTECTGFLELMTATQDKTVMEANNKKKIFILKFIYVQHLF